MQLSEIQQLPQVQSHSELVQAVSARELYKFLNPTERFGNWFERQVQYGFVHGIDFIGCEFFNTQANQTLTDYFMTVDMAKEVSMIQRSEEGKTARIYFLDCEKKLKASSQQVTLPNFTDPAEAAEAWAKEYREKQALAITLEQAKPKINHYDKVVARNQNLLNATQVAQKLGKSAYWLNPHLELLKVYNCNVKRGRAFAQWFMDKGLGVMKQTDNGFSQPLFTLTGEAWIIQKLTEQGVA